MDANLVIYIMQETNMATNEIKPITIKNWQNKLISDPKRYSKTYLKTINNQLSAILNYAVKYYQLQSNPARTAGSMGRKNAESMQFWTHDEFKTFIASDKFNNPYSKLAFKILFYTGIRLGELLALTVDDFNLNDKTLRINKNYAKIGNKELILEPKTQKSKRIITLSDEICFDISDHISKLYKPDKNDRLFNLAKSYLGKEIKRTCEYLGLKRIRVHDLRHSHASHLIELGFDQILIAERLGHEKIQTTLDTYSHLYPNKQRQIADKLNKL